MTACTCTVPDDPIACALARNPLPAGMRRCLCSCHRETCATHGAHCMAHNVCHVCRGDEKC